MKHAGKLTASALVASGVLALFTPQLSDMLTKWEGVRNVAYSDVGGVPTVCRGITNAAVQGIVVGDYWSPEKCEEVERRVVSGTQISLASCLPATITQNQFDAFSDFAHNVGVAGVCASRAVGLMWAGDAKRACDAISHAPNGTPVWSYITQGSRKVFVRGLYNRRLDERKLCLSEAG